MTNVCSLSLFPISSILGLSYPILTDASPKDWRWGVWKRRALEISQGLKVAWQETGNQDYKNWSDRMKNCSQWMKFRSTADGLKLIQGSFCGVRLCPLCMARRTKIWQAKMIQGLPELKKAFPQEKYQFLFLTLTVRNCQIKDLRNTLDWMNKSFRKLTGSDGGRKSKLAKSWPGLGWIRSVEVTHNKSDHTAHPHIHCVMVVENSYFQNGYLTHEQWINNWQKCLRVNYKPSVRITAINGISEEIEISAVTEEDYNTKPPKDKLAGSFLEVFKYQVKPQDLSNSWKWNAEYGSQMKNFKCTTANKALKPYFRFLDTNTDMIHGADQEESQRLKLETQKLIQFNWNENHQQFISTEWLG